MKGTYQKTARAGFVQACIRFIEDPNRNPLARLILALSPLVILYIISPLDLIPELFLGPLGLADDGALLIALLFIVRFVLSFYRSKKYTIIKKIDS